MSPTAQPPTAPSPVDALPRWSTADVHESLDARSFVDALEQVMADVGRLEQHFDAADVRAIEPRSPHAGDGETADGVIDDYNRGADDLSLLRACVQAVVAVDSHHERGQALLSELTSQSARLQPLLARFADWLAALGVDALCEHSSRVDEHRETLRRLAVRAEHQMTEHEEGLYAELAVTGSSAWARLQSDVTSQLTHELTFPDGEIERLAMPALRGLANHPDEAVRRTAFEGELVAWPRVATPVAAAMNAVKGEAVVVNRRRGWDSALEASLFANSVSRPTFDAMQDAVTSALPDFRRWMQTKARLHGNGDALPWWNLVAPLPETDASISWAEGLDIVRRAFADFSPQLGGLVDRAVRERWIDAPPAEGKRGGAFCMPFHGDRSLVFLNWIDSLDSVQTTAHELGHAFHNVTLAGRTHLQRRLPMALAETASIFCETLVIDAGLRQLEGADRLALLDLDLAGANQIIVDIRSRFLFESQVFELRSERTIGVGELSTLMKQAQASAYGDGLDQSTAHPYMWLLKPHYYGSHFYNWPYTYGLLFGLGLFSRYRQDPGGFRSGYEHLLSRAGMDSAEDLGALFDLDVTDEAFWQSSLDVLRDRISEYEELASASAAR